ncbi:hypothetical protein B0H14DRAFT_1071228 [Mycena olivaceomarginata]|nr:hypothetical protein B0H14DRAFT_1071228 [Mycena olivaceomarginata]
MCSRRTRLENMRGTRCMCAGLVQRRRMPTHWPEGRHWQSGALNGCEMTCNEGRGVLPQKTDGCRHSVVGGLRGGWQSGCEMTCNEVCFHRRRMDADTVTTVVVGLRGGRAVKVINTGTPRRSMRSPGGSNSGRRTASTARRGQTSGSRGSAHQGDTGKAVNADRRCGDIDTPQFKALSSKSSCRGCVHPGPFEADFTRCCKTPVDFKFRF